VNINIEVEKGKDLLKEIDTLDLDETQIPKTFEPTKALEFLNNHEFMKKTAETINAEITTV